MDAFLNKTVFCQMSIYRLSTERWNDGSSET